VDEPTTMTAAATGGGGCPECGARDRDGTSCRGQWDELLALEFTDPRAGPVHFHTVACYQLQHPAEFRLDTTARVRLLEELRGVVFEGRSVAEVRRQAGATYEGAQTVRTSGPPVAPERRDWSHTVADVGAPDPMHHAERVTEWARQVIADLTS
jgi:hypothetical protein